MRCVVIDCEKNGGKEDATGNALGKGTDNTAGNFNTLLYSTSTG